MPCDKVGQCLPSSVPLLLKGPSSSLRLYAESFFFSYLLPSPQENMAMSQDLILTLFSTYYLLFVLFCSLLLKSTLLRYNVDSINSVHFKSTVWRVLTSDKPMRHHPNHDGELFHHRSRFPCAWGRFEGWLKGRIQKFTFLRHFWAPLSGLAFSLEDESPRGCLPSSLVRVAAFTSPPDYSSPGPARAPATDWRLFGLVLFSTT